MVTIYKCHVYLLFYFSDEVAFVQPIAFVAHFGAGNLLHC